jgi:perosamine synthetase
MDRIPVSGPWITQQEIAYVADAAANAWYGNANVYHNRFERAFADYLGMRFAMALPSCTSALHLSLLALGIGPGDEVVVPDITWIASVAPVCYVGATPVFADIDPQTWCLSAPALEECITARTKAVIAVDLYGNLPDMGAVTDVARRHRLAVIEDAAEAIGSEYRGRKAGSFGDTGTFSFHGSKTLTTGEGGMLVTDREDIYQRAAVLRDHGRQPGDTMFFNSEVGYKYKMSSLQAALGLAQLERVEELVARKREIFRWYAEELDEVEGVTLNYQASHTKNTYWMVTALLDKAFDLPKNQLLTLLGQHHIDSRPFFHPLSSLPAFKDNAQAKVARDRNRVAYAISPYGVNLPSGLSMTQEQTCYVCTVLRDVLAAARGRLVRSAPTRVSEDLAALPANQGRA